MYFVCGLFDSNSESNQEGDHQVANPLREAGLVPRAMRDATRGGLAAVLHEWAEASGQTLAVDETRIPVTPEVRGACELLGLDPVHVACEGTMVIAVAHADAPRALAALQGVPESCSAAIVGEVRPRQFAPVTVRRVTGQDLPLDEPLGASLPRIC